MKIGDGFVHIYQLAPDIPEDRPLHHLKEDKEEDMSLVIAELKKLQDKQGVKFRSGFLNFGAKKLMDKEVFAVMRSPDKVWKLGNF